MGELFQSYELSAFDFRAAATNGAKFRDGWRFFGKAAQPEVSAESFAHEFGRGAAFLADDVLDLLCHSWRKVENFDDVFGGAHDVQGLTLERLGAE
jgi:hypothetical protein